MFMWIRNLDMLSRLARVVSIENSLKIKKPRRREGCGMASDAWPLGGEATRIRKRRHMVPLSKNRRQIPGCGGETSEIWPCMPFAPGVRGLAKVAVSRPHRYYTTTMWNSSELIRPKKRNPPLSGRVCRNRSIQPTIGSSRYMAIYCIMPSTNPNSS